MPKTVGSEYIARDAARRHADGIDCERNAKRVAAGKWIVGCCLDRREVSKRVPNANLADGLKVTSATKLDNVEVRIADARAMATEIPKRRERGKCSDGQWRRTLETPRNHIKPQHRSMKKVTAKRIVGQSTNSSPDFSPTRKTIA
jgi:hypothetical protein